MGWVDHIWIRNLPFKISFMVWRLWKRRLPSDDNLQRFHINIVSRCYYYEVYEQENMEHLFLKAPIAEQL